jgi:hypothetical protein
MEIKRKSSSSWVVFGLIFFLTTTWCLAAQQSETSTDKDHAQASSDPLAELSPSDRALFDALRDAVQKGHDADVLANGRKLLPALKTGTPLTDFVTYLTANAATEAGETSYALSLTKPLADAHPQDWRSAALLVRLYAESGDKDLRDKQITQLIAIHKQTSDDYFAKLHIFPIQKVKLHSGYVVFLYPFEPLGSHNSYLIAMVYTNEGKEDYRIEIESDSGDQAFFKAKKPGERRFSVDTFRKNEKNPDWPESQALHGFIDGVFDYDVMREQMLKVANETGSSKQ